MNILLAQKNSSLEPIAKMAYSKTKGDYFGMYSQFIDTSPPVVRDYFVANWHPIGEEWAMGFMFSTRNLLNGTNNRLESLNGKLKQLQVIHLLVPYFKTFKREVNIEKMNILLAQRNSSLEPIAKMAYSKTKGDYFGMYSQFIDTSSPAVRDYFVTNWHPIGEEWVMGFMFSTRNLLNGTNNRLEILNGKLK